MIKKLTVLLNGIFFGFQQFSYLFVLEANLTSASYTYLVTTASWIFGMIAGLTFFKKRCLWFHLGMIVCSTLSFYLLTIVVHKHLFEESYIWFYGLAIALSGSYAGYFFQANRERFAEDIQNLFLWENNGFIFGSLLSFLTIAFFGKSALCFFVAFLSLTLLILQIQIWNKEREEGSFQQILTKFTTIK